MGPDGHNIKYIMQIYCLMTTLALPATLDGGLNF